MKKWFLIIVVTCALTPYALAQAMGQTTALTNVTIIDLVQGTLKRDMTVIISGNMIKSVLPSKKAKLPRGSAVVNASGKFLIPGLWDMHVHMFNNIGRPGTDNSKTAFPLLLANGVIGVRDMFSDAEDIALAKRWRKEIDSGAMVGPRIFVGSRIVDGVPTFLPNLMGVKDPEEGRAAVRSLKAHGAGFIKVYWNLKPETYFAIADESKKQGIDFAGHVPFLVSARDVSDAGQKSIEHLTGIVETCSSKEDELRKKEWTHQVGEEMEATYDAKKCLELFKRFARNKTYHTPTVVLHRGMLLYDDGEFKKLSSFKYVAGTTMDEWKNSPQLNRSYDLTVRKERLDWILKTVSAMHGAGVPILAGTDNNNPFVVEGFALHDELEFFVRAGMTPLESLRTATINPVEYLGITKTHGSVTAGKIADLVLLDDDPLTNIRNTRKIAGVITNGQYLSRDDIKAMLSAVEDAVKGDNR